MGRDFVEFPPWTDRSGRISFAANVCAAWFPEDKVFVNAGLGVERLDQALQTCPGHDLIHLGEEAFETCLLALAGIFEIGKAHLAHGRLGSGGLAHFIIFRGLFGDSLAELGQLGEASGHLAAAMTGDGAKAKD